MTILVSGATGFIGSAITRHLLEAGHAVCALGQSKTRAAASHMPPWIGTAPSIF